MSETFHAVYARIVGSIDVLSRLRSGAADDEGPRQRLAIDRAQALLRNALRELSESYADQPDTPPGSVRLMGSAMVSPVATTGVDLTFTAFLADATSAAAKSGERRPGFLSPRQ